METSTLKRTAKYLKGNTSLKEKRAHEAWLASDPANEQEYALLKKLWDHSDMRHEIEGVDTEQQWEDLESRLLQETIDRPFAKTRSLSIKRYYYVAASIALIITVGYFLPLNSWFFSDVEVAEKKLGLPRVEPGKQLAIKTQLSAVDEVKSFALPDGSQVWLDDNSTLTYSDDFNESERQVTLVGRAFFDIERDTTRAFVINAKNTKIRVLGTSFNVSAAPDHNTVEVTVVSGQVAFNVMEGFRRASISLGANEKGVFYIDESLLDKRGNDDPDFMRWMEVKKEQPLKVYKRRAVNAPANQPRSESIEPKKLLDHRFQWKKNLINQTVVEGEITNYTDSTTYEHFLLKITCYNEKQKKEYAQEYIIDGPIAPGESVTYKKTFLIDWLSNTSKVDIKLENVIAK